MPKSVRLNTTHLFKDEIEFKDITNIILKRLKLYKDCTKEPISFLLNEITLSSDNPLRFRKNILSNDC